MSTPTHGLALRTLITAEGRLELSLANAPLRAPGPDEVLLRIEAAPVNPSDLGTLVGPADLEKASVSSADGSPVLTAPLVPGALERVSARLGRPLSAGLEGCGTVIAAGDSVKQLIGRRLAGMGGGMYAQYATLKAADCLVLPDEVSAAQGAACFVNPLTALSMVETMRMEGHSGLVHTAAASSLGQMLVRICQADGVPLVNIVRRPEQVALLRAMGAEHVCDSSAPDFHERLTEALRATGATLAFDAIAGGDIDGDILSCMNAALQPVGAAFNPYAAAPHKQVYVYGMLDPGPTTFARNFGMAWGLGGWLLMPFLQRLGRDGADRLRARVLAELTTTFANHYTAEVSLAEVLQPDVLMTANRRATGQKYLITPSKA